MGKAECAPNGYGIKLRSDSTSTRAYRCDWVAQNPVLQEIGRSWHDGRDHFGSFEWDGEVEGLGKGP